MKIESFRKGDKVLIRVGCGLAMADVKCVAKAAKQLIVKFLHVPDRRIYVSFVLRHYDSNGNLIQKKTEEPRKKREENLDFL